MFLFIRVNLRRKKQSEKRTHKSSFGYAQKVLEVADRTEVLRKVAHRSQRIA